MENKTRILFEFRFSSLPTTCIMYQYERLLYMHLHAKNWMLESWLKQSVKQVVTVSLPIILQGVLMLVVLGDYFKKWMLL